MFSNFDSYVGRSWQHTLEDIRVELATPYRDMRDPYKSPDKEQLFSLVTKETPQTFNRGTLCTRT